MSSTRRTQLWAQIGSILLVGLASPSAIATTINVPADQPNIQAGINAAIGGDEVVLAEERTPAPAT